MGRRIILGIALGLSTAPVAVLAATPTDFRGLADFFVSIINAVTGVAIALGVLYYLWGVVRILKEDGSAKSWQTLRTQVGWGIIALFVMFGIWGILRVLGNTLFGTDNFSSLG